MNSYIIYSVLICTMVLSNPTVLADDYVAASRVTMSQVKLNAEIAGLDKKQVKCVAENIYHEARGESIKGQIAVSHVVMNRVKKLGKSACQVIHFSVTKIRDDVAQLTCAFTWTCDEDKRTNSTAYKKHLHIARMVMVNAIPDPTGGATHYHTHAVMPYWHNSYTKTVSIGNHIFLKKGNI